MISNDDDDDDYVGMPYPIDLTLKKSFSFSAKKDPSGFWTWTDSQGNPIDMCNPIANSFNELSVIYKEEFLHAFIFDMYRQPKRASHFMGIVPRYDDILTAFRVWKKENIDDVYDLGWC